MSRIAKEQLTIDGTQEVRDPELDERLDAWLSAKAEQATAADTTKIRHASLLEAMAERGVERYSFVDAKTGRKQFVVADKTPKAKVVKAPSRRETREIAEEVERPDPAKVFGDDRVESRRVKRKDVETELDPFAAARKTVAERDGLLADAARAQDANRDGTP